MTAKLALMEYIDDEYSTKSLPRDDEFYLKGTVIRQK